MTLRWTRGLLVLFCISLLSSVHEGRLAGQSAGPRPNFAVTRMPGLVSRPVPADFNNDGRMDLVAGRRIENGPTGGPLIGGQLVVTLGNGDGTFGAERIVATPDMAAPLGAADFNHDGNVDVLAIENRLDSGPRSRPVWLLPGRGDGTFDPAVIVDAALPTQWRWAPPASATIADFDGDTHLDIAVTVDPDVLVFYPGNGDFTFDPRATMTTGASPMGLTAADLNGDGRLDVAVATRDGNQVNVFMNTGGFVFAPSSIPLDRAAFDVAAADLNADGRLDLVVAAATEDFDFRSTFHDGRVLVMLGNGDGTFQAPTGYATPRGTNSVVSADFNRDGIPDVAAANFTGGDEEECGPLWGSVSILRGSGGGALASAANFQMSYDPADFQFQNRPHSLYAAYFDGDTHPDLVTSGAVLLNRPPATNRPPTANAGPDQTGGQAIQLRGQASDPDNDYLTYVWTDETGRVIENCLEPFFYSSGPGEHTYTLTVSDGRGGTATDSVTVRDVSTQSGPSLTIHRPSFHNPVPANAPYSIQFSASAAPGREIVDIDISVDRNGQNNFTPIANCTNLPGTATECTWPDPGPPSNDAALFFKVTDSQGSVLNTVARFQIVEGPRGALPAGWSNADVGAVGAAGAAGYDGRVFTVRGSGADIWGTADEFHWAFTTISGDFEVIGRVATVQRVHDWTKAGLMIRESQAPGSRHASIFATPGPVKPVSFQRRPVTNGESVHTAGGFASPPVWLMLRRAGDVVTAFYRTAATGPWIEIGSQTLTGLSQSVLVGLPVSSHVDGALATASFDNVSISSSSAPRLRVLRPAAGERVQTQASYTIRWMPENGGEGIARYDVFYSFDPTVAWHAIPECTNLSPDLRSCIWKRPGPTGPSYIKVVATSTTGVQGAAYSEQFQITAGVSGPGGTPPGWSCGDIGAVGAPGSCHYETDGELSPDFIVQGSGADIWGAADEFSYASYAAYGDFSFTARVQWVDNIHRWTKAGLMIRDSSGLTLDPADDRHASFFVTPTTEKGTAFQRRPVEGGASVHTAGPVTTAPVWLKLVRTGDTIRAYYRKEWTDAWTFVGEQVFSGLPYQLNAMLVVSSHVDGTLARASFDNVIIDEQMPMQSADIGATVPGTTSSNGVETTIEGNGADIWGTADAFRYHYTRWHGYGTITVRVRSLEDTHAWAKAGVMFRETLAPDSKHVMAIVSSSRGIAMQSRAATGGASVSTVPVMVNAPVWLTLRRYDNTFTASWSQDGEIWYFLGQVEIPMAAGIFVGLPVTSHAAGTLATALFDDFFIQSR